MNAQCNTKLSTAMTPERVYTSIPLDKSPAELIWSIQNNIEWFLCNGVASWRIVVSRDKATPSVNLMMVGEDTPSGDLIPKSQRLGDLHSIGVVPVDVENSYFKTKSGGSILTTIYDLEWPMTLIAEELAISTYASIESGGRKFHHQLSVTKCEIWSDVENSAFEADFGSSLEEIFNVQD